MEGNRIGARTCSIFTYIVLYLCYTSGNPLLSEHSTKNKDLSSLNFMHQHNTHNQEKVYTYQGDMERNSIHDIQYQPLEQSKNRRAKFDTFHFSEAKATQPLHRVKRNHDTMRSDRRKYALVPIKRNGKTKYVLMKNPRFVSDSRRATGDVQMSKRGEEIVLPKRISENFAHQVRTGQITSNARRGRISEKRAPVQNPSGQRGIISNKVNFRSRPEQRKPTLTENAAALSNGQAPGPTKLPREQNTKAKVHGTSVNQPTFPSDREVSNTRTFKGSTKEDILSRIGGGSHVETAPIPSFNTRPSLETARPNTGSILSRMGTLPGANMNPSVPVVSPTDMSPFSNVGISRAAQASRGNIVIPRASATVVDGPHAVGSVEGLQSTKLSSDSQNLHSHHSGHHHGPGAKFSHLFTAGLDLTPAQLEKPLAPSVQAAVSKNEGSVASHHDHSESSKSASKHSQTEQISQTDTGFGVKASGHSSKSTITTASDNGSQVATVDGGVATKSSASGSQVHSVLSTGQSLESSHFSGHDHHGRSDKASSLVLQVNDIKSTGSVADSVVITGQNEATKVSTNTGHAKKQSTSGNSGIVSETTKISGEHGQGEMSKVSSHTHQTENVQTQSSTKKVIETVQNPGFQTSSTGADNAQVIDITGKQVRIAGNDIKFLSNSGLSAVNDVNSPIRRGVNASFPKNGNSVSSNSRSSRIVGREKLASKSNGNQQSSGKSSLPSFNALGIESRANSVAPAGTSSSDMEFLSWKLANKKRQPGKTVVKGNSNSILYKIPQDQMANVIRENTMQKAPALSNAHVQQIRNAARMANRMIDGRLPPTKSIPRRHATIPPPPPYNREYDANLHTAGLHQTKPPSVSGNKQSVADAISAALQLLPSGLSSNAANSAADASSSVKALLMRALQAIQVTPPTTTTTTTTTTPAPIISGNSDIANLANTFLQALINFSSRGGNSQEATKAITSLATGLQGIIGDKSTSALSGSNPKQETGSTAKKTSVKAVGAVASAKATASSKSVKTVKKTTTKVTKKIITKKSNIASGSSSEHIASSGSSAAASSVSSSNGNSIAQSGGSGGNSVGSGKSKSGLTSAADGSARQGKSGSSASHAGEIIPATVAPTPTSTTQAVQVEYATTTASPTTQEAAEERQIPKWMTGEMEAEELLMRMFFSMLQTTTPPSSAGRGVKSAKDSSGGGKKNGEEALGPLDRVNTTDVPEEIEPTAKPNTKQEGVADVHNGARHVAGWATTTESALGPLDRVNTTDVPEEIEQPTPASQADGAQVGVTTMSPYVSRTRPPAYRSPNNGPPSDRNGVTKYHGGATKIIVKQAPINSVQQQENKVQPTILFRHFNPQTTTPKPIKLRVHTNPNGSVKITILEGKARIKTPGPVRFSTGKEAKHIRTNRRRPPPLPPGPDFQTIMDLMALDMFI